MSKISQKIDQFLWHKQWPSIFKPVLFVLRLLFALAQDLIKGDINLRAMSLVYTLLLSLVPLLAFSFSLFKAFGLHNQMQPLLKNFLQPLGERSTDLSAQILGFVSNIDVRLLGVVGLSLLLYAVIRLMQKIQKALDFTWELDIKPAWGKRFADYISLLMVGPLLVLALISAASAVGDSSVVQRLVQFSGAAGVFQSLTEWMPTLVLTFGFAFIYWFLPNTKVRFYSAIAGGLVAAILWKSMGIVFTRFIVGSSQYQVYSAFASVLLFMIWIYLTWLIFLLGSKIAYYCQNPQQMAVHEKNHVFSTGYLEKAALSIYALIGRRFKRKQTALSSEEIARKLMIPAHIVTEVLKHSERQGYLAKTADSHQLWLPAVAFGELSIAEVFSMLKSTDINKMIASDQIEALILRLNQSTESQLIGMTIDDIVNVKSGEMSEIT